MCSETVNFHTKTPRQHPPAAVLRSDRRDSHAQTVVSTTAGIDFYSAGTDFHTAAINSNAAGIDLKSVSSDFATAGVDSNAAAVDFCNAGIDFCSDITPKSSAKVAFDSDLALNDGGSINIAGSLAPERGGRM